MRGWTEGSGRFNSHADGGKRSRSPRSTCEVETVLAGVPVGGDLGSELKRLERRLRPLHNCLLIDGVLLKGTIAATEASSKTLVGPACRPLQLRPRAGSRRSRLAATIELRRSKSTPAAARRRPWLKALGWAAVVALSCFIVAVAAGLIHDDIKEPKRWPGPAPEVERNANGWGEPESFVGQYHVHFLRNIGPTRSNGYAEFAGERFREGQLTMFMREVYEHRPHVPGGVLVLNGHTHNLVLYLSELSSNGRVLYATVRGGTYEGPAIGSFGGVKRGNRIFGGLSLRGLANVEANFIRYSKNPDSRSAGSPTGAGGPPTEVLE